MFNILKIGTITLTNHCEEINGIKYRRFLFNRAKATTHHRIEVNKPVWTILVHGRRYNAWSVIDDKKNILSSEPWRGVGGRTSYKPE